MSYKVEKNPVSGELEMIISGWERGIGESPETGIELLSGVNIKNYPRIAYQNTGRTDSTQGTLATFPVNYMIQDPSLTANCYAVTQNGKVFQSIDSGKTWTPVADTPTIGHGNGIVILPMGTGYSHPQPNNWLFVATDTKVYVIEITATGATGAWTELTYDMGTEAFGNTAQPVGSNHYAIASIAVNQVSGTLSGGLPVLFFCNVGFIASLQSVDGNPFDPTDPTSYIWNPENLILPTVGGGIATSMVELKGNLYTSIGNLIVPWDYVSTNYGIPFAYTEFISKLTLNDNIIYSFGGAYIDVDGLPWNPSSGSVYIPFVSGRGYVYYYDGWTGGVFKKIPDHLAGQTATLKNFPTWTIGGTMRHLNKLYFGPCFNFTDSTAIGLGILSIDLSNDALTIENNQGVFYTSLLSFDNTLVNKTTISFAGFYLTVPHGTLKFDYTSQGGISEIGTIKTDIVKVGTNLNQRTFDNIEVRLRNPLLHNETVAVTVYNYFTNQVAGNYVYTAPTSDTSVSFLTPVFFQADEYIQIKLVTTSVTNGSGCPIQEIIIR